MNATFYIVLFGFLISFGLIDSEFSGNWIMSGDNLLSHLQLKFYSEGMPVPKTLFFKKIISRNRWIVWKKFWSWLAQN